MQTNAKSVSQERSHSYNIGLWVFGFYPKFELNANLRFREFKTINSDKTEEDICDINDVQGKS